MKITNPSIKIDTMKIVIVSLLMLNLLLGVYIAFFKSSAYSLEVMKVGGRENMEMAHQLYTSDVYIQQQKMTLEQILGSIEQDPSLHTPQMILEDTSVIDDDFVEIQ